MDRHVFTYYISSVTFILYVTSLSQGERVLHILGTLFEEISVV